MQITFKDVGQGDSIILEWEHDGINKIGIIDCKTKGSSNPVVSYLQEKGYLEIEFFILSHPHKDHYSGLDDLLNFIEEKKICINKFGHTLINIGSDFWKWFDVSNEDSRILTNIVLKANHHKDNTGLIKKFVNISEDWTINLSDAITIKAIAPSYEEIRLYQREIEFNYNENLRKASGAANYLSTIISISNGNSNILLTSDAEIETFNRLHNENKLINIEYSLCQAPHHGSFNNYLNTFWDNLNVAEERDVVFSAGINERYKHPHLETVKCFRNNGYNLHPTNLVYGINDYIEEINSLSLILDTISEIVEESITGGDKVFNF